ncbi:MAG: hypothetical protein FD170_119 [Bacteroidetes bacterium]|nr:MAG: hypothetical protein FD170_119 [Bacteroidota bacterium]
MKRHLLLLCTVFILGCNGNKIPDAPKTTIRPSEPTYMDVSFEFASQYAGDKSAVLSSVAVFYTNDNDSLFLNKEWAKAIKAKMKNMSADYANVLLFDSKEHTPNVETKGMQFPEKYNKYMVCGYWNHPNVSDRFCYGGVKPDGNFKVCE